MSSIISLPDPCLTAILLVCQTRSGSGPQLVFHWPPDPPSALATSRKNLTDTESFERDYDSEDDSEYSSSGESSLDLSPLHDRPYSAKASSQHTDWTTSEHDRHDPAPSKAPTLLGLDEDGLVSLLAPDRSWNKRKFELRINHLTFVGRPIFAKQNGSWRKPPTPRKPVQRSTSPDHVQTTDDDTAQSASEESGQEATPTEETKEPAKSELIMFHVVFVLSPPRLDHTHRVREMYDNVVKRLSKALKWVQTRHDYVRLEAEKIMVQRQHLSTPDQYTSTATMSKLIDISPLAKAIATVFRSISVSKIASVTLLPGASISLQIPPITSTAYLPSLSEPPLPPGLWLTTATEAAPTEESTNRNSASSTTLQLAKTHTLLLKSSPPKIAKDAQLAGGILASHLPKFVAALKPTKSFYKLSKSAQISLGDIRLFARHLIYWRRAIEIPPLHQRDTYIVSPNADFGKFHEACKIYEAQFPPPLPSLSKFLADLSDTPLPFRSLIPSTDHKVDYMLALAWLLRNGWVTQLRTFAYIRVTSEVKQQSRERARESRASVSQSFNSASESSGPKTNGPDGHSRPSFVSRRSSDGRISMRDMQTTERIASLVKSPSRASPEEFRWLNYLHEGMLDETDVFGQLDEAQRHELYQHWPILLRYFDGSTAIESAPVREGLGRELVWNLYSRLGLRFNNRVEDTKGQNQTILLTIRHW